MLNTMDTQSIKQTMEELFLLFQSADPTHNPLSERLVLRYHSLFEHCQ